MKTFFKLLIVLLLLNELLAVMACNASRGSWEPKRVKMGRVGYNGGQVTKGYTGY